MPLQEGSSHEIISANIAELISAGHSKEQAAAIAYKKAGRGKAEDVATDSKPHQLAFDRAPDNMLRIEANVYDALKKSRQGMALDFNSVRTKSVDGHLHVSSTPISKSNICGYLGREINGVMDGEPGWKPLEDDKMYQLLRDPEELKKAAHTFNNLPILNHHVAVTADAYPQDFVVGSTGTDADFQEPYLSNSMALWSGPDINKVEKNKRRELSSAYRYRADMTPGTYKGQPYDGRMTDIVGNHIALVEEGRAGADVHVNDAALPTMKNLFVADYAQSMGNMFSSPATMSSLFVPGVTLTSMFGMDDETKHDPANGQFIGSGGGSSSGSAEKKKISKEVLKTKLEGISHERLVAALNHKDTDSGVKKAIEAELDERANRGSSKGHGETVSKEEKAGSPENENFAQRLIRQSKEYKPPQNKTSGQSPATSAVGLQREREYRMLGVTPPKHDRTPGGVPINHKN